MPSSSTASTGNDCSFDSFACDLLSDAPAYVIDGSGNRLKVQHGFEEDQLSRGFVYARRIFALAAFIGICVWPVLDRVLPSAGALVTGAQNGYAIDAVLPDNSPKHLTATTRICTCSYNNMNIYTPHAPYARVKPNAAVKNMKCPDTFLRQCNSTEFDVSEILQNATATDAISVAMYSILAQVCFQMLDLEIQSPIASAELQQVAWNIARFNDATRRVQNIGSWGQNAIKTLQLPPTNLTGNMSAKGVLAVKMLQTNFLTNLRSHMGLIAENGTFTTVGNKRINLTCPNLPSQLSDMPLSLVEWCVKTGSRGAIVPCGDTNDAYEAYQQWCAPVVCYKIGPKSPYQRTVESLSILGGVYGIVTLCIFAIIWRCCICIEKRRKKHWKPFTLPVPKLLHNSCTAVSNFLKMSDSAPLPQPATALAAMPPSGLTLASPGNASVRQSSSRKDTTAADAPLLAGNVLVSNKSTASSCDARFAAGHCDSARHDQNHAHGAGCPADEAV